MSWRASGWAKATRGMKGQYGTKLILMILSDYYNDAEGKAWPTIKQLAEDCEMPERTVKWCLGQLSAKGLISRTRKGNQYQSSTYILYLAVTHAKVSESTVRAGAVVAPSGVGAVGGGVQVQSQASEGAVPVGANRQEPTREPTIYSSSTIDFQRILKNRWGFDGSVDMWDVVEEKYSGLALKDEAVKIIGWLKEHQKRKCSTAFLLNWLEKARNGREAHDDRRDISEPRDDSAKYRREAERLGQHIAPPGE